MLRKLIIALLLPSLLIIPVSATEYLTDIKVQQIQSGSWTSASEKTMNIGESWDYGSITIKYKILDSSNDKIWFYVTGSSISTPDWLFKEGETWCIRGNDCSENASNASSNAIKMTLKDIRPSSTSTNITAENPISGYVYVSPKEISLIKDDVASVDVQKVRTDTGVSYTKTTSEVMVYFIRKPNVPISISVKAESRTPKNEEWTSDRVKYTIDSSGTYMFTIKYTKNNAWGAETDITETYGLKLLNLGDGASTTSGVTKYRSTVYLPDTLIVEMGTAGSFTEQDAVSPTKLSSSEYKLSFNSAGTYKLKYITTGGTVVDDAVIATVRASQPTPEHTEEEPATEEELTGNQQQDGEGGSNWLLWGGVSAVAIILLGYMLTRKKATYDVRPQ